MGNGLSLWVEVSVSNLCRYLIGDLRKLLLFDIFRRKYSNKYCLILMIVLSYVWLGWG